MNCDLGLVGLGGGDILRLNLVFFFKSNVKAWLMLVLFSVFALFVSLFMVLCSIFLGTLFFLF